MAFAITIDSIVNMGGSAGARMLLGHWSGAAGDAAGTLSVAGPLPWMAIFQKFDSLDNTYEILPRVGTSYSNGITTYTIENQDNVTNGRFTIIESGF